jgi:glucose/arabinose dehydrogenase
VPVNGTSLTFRLIPNTRGAIMIVTSPPHDLRKFAVDEGGYVKQMDDTGFTTTLLDISNQSDLAAGGEQGLLGLVFHPQFATNHYFYIYYTTSDANVVDRYEISATDPNKADPATRTQILSIPDFASNHNGGMMEFGSDGFLYIGTGDGGGGGDPNKNGQNQTTLLGKMLRIDVDHPGVDKPYSIPKDNPYGNEVFMTGLRNPWRWAFDPANGDLYIGDVGQGEVEELDIVPAGKGKGLNFGWNMYEADKCFASPCDAAGKTMPNFSKTHAENWCAIIGGAVYRGSCYPDIVGQYYFSDYCSHELWAATKMAGPTWVFSQPTVSNVDENGTHAGFPDAPASLHADSRGELFLTAGKGVYRLEAGP